MIRLSSPQTYDTNAQVKLKNQIASQRLSFLAWFVG